MASAEEMDNGDTIVLLLQLVETDAVEQVTNLSAKRRKTSDSSRLGRLGMFCPLPPRLSWTGVSTVNCSTRCCSAAATKMEMNAAIHQTENALSAIASMCEWCATRTANSAVRHRLRRV